MNSKRSSHTIVNTNQLNFQDLQSQLLQSSQSDKASYRLIRIDNDEESTNEDSNISRRFLINQDDSIIQDGGFLSDNSSDNLGLQLLNNNTKTETNNDNQAIIINDAGQHRAIKISDLARVTQALRNPNSGVINNQSLNNVKIYSQNIRRVSDSNQVSLVSPSSRNVSSRRHSSASSIQGSRSNTGNGQQPVYFVVSPQSNNQPTINNLNNVTIVNSNNISALNELTTNNVNSQSNLMQPELSNYHFKNTTPAPCHIILQTDNDRKTIKRRDSSNSLISPNSCSLEYNKKDLFRKRPMNNYRTPSSDHIVFDNKRPRSKIIKINPSAVNNLLGGNEIKKEAITSSSQKQSTNSPIKINLKNPRDAMKRKQHNEVERRRRDKINSWIIKLSQILPDSENGNKSPDKKETSDFTRGFSKGKILEKVYDMIMNLQEENRNLENCLCRQKVLMNFDECNSVSPESQQYLSIITKLQKENDHLKSELMQSNEDKEDIITQLKENGIMFTTVDNNETSPHNSETQNQPQIDRTTSEEKIEANDKLIVDDIDDSINMKLPESSPSLPKSLLITKTNEILARSTTENDEEKS